MKVLLTGGLGYIGSHTAVQFLEEGYEVVIIDNLSNSKIDMLDKIKSISKKSVTFYKEDLLNYSALENILKEEKPDWIVHFAGYKAVGESVAKPLMYYENNLGSTINLLNAMISSNTKNLIFSSSATVYGKPETVPIMETSRLTTTNPYGRTKLFIEEILKDFALVNKDFNITILRYFNPVGAHSSALIGENPNGIPNNLMPYITKVAMHKLDHLNVFGNDYKTHDGTGVRDYIHVVDLANAHVLATKSHQKTIQENVDLENYLVYNIGTGNGYSVLDIVHSFEKANGIKVNYTIAPRRPGDIDECYASSEKAYKDLKFKAKHSLDEMCKSAYNFEKNNS